MKRLNVVLTLLTASMALAAGVWMEETTIALPSAAPGEAAAQPATYLTMENEWLRFGVLPGRGGCLFSLVEKRTGREVIRGRAGEERPVDWKLVKEKRTRRQAIWTGGTDARDRLKWSVGRSLLPNLAVLRAECVVMNRGRYAVPMLTGVDGLAPCGEDGKGAPGRSLGVDAQRVAWTALKDEAGGELLVGRSGGGRAVGGSIGPGETRWVRQLCYPVKGIGEVTRASIEGAVGMTRHAKREEMQVGFHSTSPRTGCTVEIRRGGEAVFTEPNVTIGPNTPWCKVVTVAADAEDAEFTVTLADAAGKVVLTSAPAPEVPQVSKFPDEPPRESAEAARAVQLAKSCAYDSAEKLLRAALAGKEKAGGEEVAELRYLLACVLEEQGLAVTDLAARRSKFGEAEDLCRRVRGDKTWGRPALAALARLACLKGGAWMEALDHVDAACSIDDREAKLHVLKAYIRRRQRNLTACSKELRLAARLDPLDAWGVAERAFLEDDGADAVLNMGENRSARTQELLETVSDYWSIGAWREVAVLCDQANLFALREKGTVADGASYQCALFDYFGGFALEMMGHPDLAKARYAKAAAQPTDRCHPSRREEYAVLKRAAECCPELANTWYYLGVVEWGHGQKEAARASWRRALAIQPDHAPARRRLDSAQ